MKIQKNGETVVLTREELDSVLTHIRQFESLVKQLEKHEATGKLTPELKRPWSKLKNFLVSQELPGSEDSEGSDGRYCCTLRTKAGQIVNCRDYNAWYVFAWAACVTEAMAGGFDGTLVSGRCRKRRGCPQAS